MSCKDRKRQIKRKAPGRTECTWQLLKRCLFKWLYLKTASLTITISGSLVWRLHSYAKSYALLPWPWLPKAIQVNTNVYLCRQQPSKCYMIPLLGLYCMVPADSYKVCKAMPPNALDLALPGSCWTTDSTLWVRNNCHLYCLKETDVKDYAWRWFIHVIQSDFYPRCYFIENSWKVNCGLKITSNQP